MTVTEERGKGREAMGKSEGHCEAAVEVYSRVCGFFRPVQQWNRGKREEFRERRTYRTDGADWTDKKTSPEVPEGGGDQGALEEASI